MQVNSVLGPLDGSQLGVVLMHEHIQIDLMRITRLPDHLLDEAPLAVAELGAFTRAGGSTVVELSSGGLGRKPDVVRDIAIKSGINVILGTGWYRDPYLPDEIDTRSADDMALELERDLTTGIGESGIKAGIIGEIGWQGSYCSPREERVFRAAARAHRKTGATLTTHALNGPTGLKQLDLLAEEGVDPRRVIIGHCDSYDDSDYHEAVARRGAWVQFDLIRGRHDWDVDKRIRLISEFIRRGHGDKLLLSHDICMKSHLHAYGGTGYDYLLTGFQERAVGAGVPASAITDAVTGHAAEALGCA